MADKIKGTFLKLAGPDIKGNVKHGKYKDQIMVEGVGFQVNNSAQAVHLKKEKTAGGRSASLSDVSFVKDIDNASSQLNGHCAAGTLFKEATITMVDGDPIYTVKLGPVVVSSVSTALGDGNGSEQVTLNFSKAEWQFAKESSDWWDISDGSTSIK